MKYILLLLPVLLLAACQDEPPELMMETEQSRAAGILESYSWSWWGGGTEQSGSLPTETIHLMDVEVVTASPGEEAELSFADNSSSEIQADRWEENTPAERLDTENGSLLMPDESGTHPVDVYADRQDTNNSAHYTFLVEVEE
ncbi:hypothetical protein [Alkalicoccus halolimnae]|uniref:Uncharacterized protein n=1 Tax=Alkalicoccus halolimnae TaxID=1667239 RepID=A0A5C7F730_9BACI|nr:hypothetical protein [Alkalicoccus halolimnae]TXF85380.1 hypothetical protein FTX54_09370 [Alkalicoccus halolimnae]